MSQNLSLPDLIQQGQLPPHSEEKNVVSQINRYNRWLVESGRRLYQPDLEAYRDYLLGQPQAVERQSASVQHPAQLQGAGQQPGTPAGVDCLSGASVSRRGFRHHQSQSR
jgi:hypothetical protein